METVQQRLENEMMERGWSHAKMAELTGQKVATVKSWLDNKSEPHAQALAMLAGLGVDVYFLLTGRTGPVDEVESEMIEAFRGCSRERRAELMNAAARGREEHAKAEKESTERFLFGR